MEVYLIKLHYNGTAQINGLWSANLGLGRLWEEHKKVGQAKIIADLQ